MRWNLKEAVSKSLVRRTEITYKARLREISWQKATNNYLKLKSKTSAFCNTTVHIYRKTFASELYSKTKNVKIVSILLGHANTAVTEKYYLVDDIDDIKY